MADNFCYHGCIKNLRRIKVQKNKTSDNKFETVVKTIMLIIILIILFSIPGKFSEFSKEASRNASDRRESYDQKLRNNPANHYTGQDLDRLRTKKLKNKKN